MLVGAGALPAAGAGHSLADRPVAGWPAADRPAQVPAAVASAGRCRRCWLDRSCRRCLSVFDRLDGSSVTRSASAAAWIAASVPVCLAGGAACRLGLPLAAVLAGCVSLLLWRQAWRCAVTPAAAQKAKRHSPGRRPPWLHGAARSQERQSGMSLMLATNDNPMMIRTNPSQGPGQMLSRRILLHFFARTGMHDSTNRRAGAAGPANSAACGAHPEQREKPWFPGQKPRDPIWHGACDIVCRQQSIWTFAP